jgi:Leucine-rich repeat (LRR) protein
LTSLDISSNLLLTLLYFGSNDLTSVDISNNMSIKKLECSGIALQNFNDITQHDSLILLSCADCQLDALDLSMLTDLEFLDCSGNNLSTLDVSGNTALIDLECAENQLTSLDVTSQYDLRILKCGGNLLTTLDLSNNSSLGKGYENTSNIFLNITDMPFLQKVCVWTMPFPPAGFHLDKSGSPNVYFTNICSR